MNSRILSILTFSFCLIPAFQHGYRDSEWFTITNFLVLFLASLFLYQNEAQPFSLYKAFMIFVLIFFGLAPMIQFRDDTKLFGGVTLPDDAHIITNLIVIGILVSYKSIYGYFFKRKETEKELKFLERFELRIKLLSSSDLFFLYVFSLISFFIVFYAYGFNTFNLFLRGGVNTGGISVGGTVMLLVKNFFRPMPMLIVLFYHSVRGKTDFHFFALFLIALITAFPTAIPRFAVGVIYIPIVFRFFHFFRKKNIFAISIVLGLMLLFPFLDSFRRYSDNTVLKVGFNFDMFNEGHFDSYSSLMRICYYDIITYGRQLLGVFFFYVPRVFWPSKPVGSGVVMSKEIGLEFDNISCNFFAEGYINFGIVGIILFTYFFAMAAAKVDKMYWKTIPGQSLKLFETWYLIILGFMFFILRGDLLSSTAYLTGFSTAFFSIPYFFKKKRSWGERLL